MTIRNHDSYRQGVLAAASLAAEYRTNHLSRIDDCIAIKLGATSRKRPRKNPRHLENESVVLARGVARGMALALVEINRLYRCPREILSVARRAGLTLRELRAAGVDRSFLSVLRQAGLR